jgi:hypothetical protein
LVRASVVHSFAREWWKGGYFEEQLERGGMEGVQRLGSFEGLSHLGGCSFCSLKCGMSLRMMLMVRICIWIKSEVELTW